MQGQARVLKAIDTKTGKITLCGVGAERLAQATAAGLISGELRADVDAVRRENERLTRALAASERDARHELHRASQLRREKLDGYLREEAVRENRRTLAMIGWGWFGLGVAAGSSLMAAVAAMMM